MSQFKALAEQVMARCDELGAISQHPNHVDRRYLTAEHKKANALVASWMEQANMMTWQDGAGNLWGRYESKAKDAKCLLIGSHLDTVPNGGKYDGMLGVIAPIAMVQHFAKTGAEFPFHIDIVGFGDEEGTRFGSTLLGSRALVGNWPQEWADLTDVDGISLRQALAEFGLEFDAVNDSKVDAASVHAYVELHIEQGPVLEQRDLAVGVVSAIAGAKRFAFTVTGFAGHAGTVPMGLRQDALAGASEMILAVEQIAANSGVVATVGKIDNRPNGVNVISGKTQFSLDIRCDNDNLRDTTLTEIISAFEQIAQRRNLQVNYEQTHSAPAVVCSNHLQEQLTAAVEHCQGHSLTLLSGAGHDAMAIADICPVAMLFTRCEKGISHHPGEAITSKDVDISLATLHHFVSQFQPPKQV